MAIQTIRVTQKCELAFGLSWEQLDPFSESEHGAIKRWRAMGYTSAARYSQDGGRVYGMANAEAALPKGTLAGAAVLATHPMLRGQTGLVLLEVEIGGVPSVICVGLRAGVVVVDRIVSTSEVATVRHTFLKDHAPDQQFPTWGDVHTIAAVDHEFPLSNLVPGKDHGKPVRMGALRSSRWPIIIGSVLGVGLVCVAAWQAWLYSAESDARMAEMRLRESQTPQVLYTAEIERWLKRPIATVGPALDALRTALQNFPLFYAGWVVEKMTCQSTQCSVRWVRKDGTLQEFQASAPSQWRGITPVDQDSLVMSVEVPTTSTHLDRTQWPKASDYRAKLTSQWQFLAPGGWKASMGPVTQQAIPSTFTPEQAKAVNNMPGAPFGMEINVKDQAWWYADQDPNSPVSSNALGESLELTSPIELSFNGQNVTFSFTGTAYVQP